MYIVSITNGEENIKIHNAHHKLFTGSVAQGINTIDSFSFSLLPNNPGFGALNDFTTLVDVYNTRRQRYEFRGRVLYTSQQMNEKGLLTQEAVCESFFGFLCDSCQDYVPTQYWLVHELLNYLILKHNAQVESYKHFRLGQVEVEDPDKVLTVGIDRSNTWDAIKKTLLDVLGGEIRFRVTDGLIYLDYVPALGETKSTGIKLSHNMKAIVKEKNPANFITRLIPLGAKKSENKEESGDEEEDESESTEETEDTDERYDITSVNDGKNYIDDEAAIAMYGIHVGYKEFDQVTRPADLLYMARKWLKENNKIAVKYNITALDLSLIDKDMDDFEVCNTHPIENRLLGIDDVARINKKTIDVCDETKTSIEIGENFKTLSEIQREQRVSMAAYISDIRSKYVTKQNLVSEIKPIREEVSQIKQTQNSIDLSVYAKYTDLDGYATIQRMEEAEAKLALAVLTDKDGKLKSAIYIGANLLTIETDHFTLDDEACTVKGEFISDNEEGEVKLSEGGAAFTRYNDYSGDEVITINGQSISLENHTTSGNTTGLTLKRIGSILSGETVYGVYGIETDGRLRLSASAIQVKIGGEVKNLNFNDNGSVTWS